MRTRLWGAVGSSTLLRGPRMTWHDSLPTEDGFYFAKRHWPESEITVIQKEGKFFFALDVEGDCFPSEMIAMITKWWGPIPPPPKED